MSPKQFLWVSGLECMGASELLNRRRGVEHWIENHQVKRPGCADFETDDGERMSTVLEIYRWFVGHVNLLVKIEEVVATEILTYGEKKGLMCHEIAAAGKRVGFTPGEKVSYPSRSLDVFKLTEWPSC